MIEADNIKLRRQFDFAGFPQTMPVDYILEADDVLVYTFAEEGLPVQMARGVHFTVDGVGQEAGGSVTVTSAPITNPESFLVINRPDIKQPFEYNQNDDFPAKSHEFQMDRMALIAKRLQSDLERSLRLPEDDPDLDTTLPRAHLRSNLFLAFDENGKPIATAADPSTGLPLPAGSPPVLSWSPALELQDNGQYLLPGDYTTNQEYEVTVTSTRTNGLIRQITFQLMASPYNGAGVPETADKWLVETIGTEQNPGEGLGGTHNLRFTPKRFGWHVLVVSATVENGDVTSGRFVEAWFYVAAPDAALISYSGLPRTFADNGNAVFSGNFQMGREYSFDLELQRGQNLIQQVFVQLVASPYTDEEVPGGADKWAYETIVIENWPGGGDGGTIPVKFVPKRSGWGAIKVTVIDEHGRVGAGSDSAGVVVEDTWFLVRSTLPTIQTQPTTSLFNSKQVLDRTLRKSVETEIEVTVNAGAHPLLLFQAQLCASPYTDEEVPTGEERWLYEMIAAEEVTENPQTFKLRVIPKRSGWGAIKLWLIDTTSNFQLGDTAPGVTVKEVWFRVIDGLHAEITSAKPAMLVPLPGIAGTGDPTSITLSLSHNAGEEGIIGFTWQWWNWDTEAWGEIDFGVGQAAHISADGDDVVVTRPGGTTAANSDTRPYDRFRAIVQWSPVVTGADGTVTTAVHQIDYLRLPVGLEDLGDFTELVSDVQDLQASYTSLNNEQTALAQAIVDTEALVQTRPAFTSGDSFPPDPEPGAWHVRTDQGNRLYTYSGASWVERTDSRLSSVVTQTNTLQTAVNGVSSSVTQIQQSVNGLYSKWAVQVNSNGEMVGYVKLDGTGAGSTFKVRADQIALGNGTYHVHIAGNRVRFGSSSPSGSRAEIEVDTSFGVPTFSCYDSVQGAVSYHHGGGMVVYDWASGVRGDRDRIRLDRDGLAFKNASGVSAPRGRLSSAGALYYNGTLRVGANGFNGPNGTKVLGDRITGWGGVSGTISRAAFTVYSGPIPTSFSEVHNRLTDLERRFGALLIDQRAHGLIGS